VHDDVVMLLDRHLRHLEGLHRRLCASRQVDWGERGDALAASVVASRRFAAAAADLLAQIGGVTQPPDAPPATHDDQWNDCNSRDCGGSRNVPTRRDRPNVRRVPLSCSPGGSGAVPSDS
jgi:hypothetical protein